MANVNNLKVGPDDLRATSHTIRGLIDEFNGAMQHYLTTTQHLAGAGGWTGPASMANLASTEEIHRAQTNLTTRWSGLCDHIDAAAAQYDEQERINAQRAAAVGHA
jgi:WXG100 family type VII secretion target